MLSPQRYGRPLDRLSAIVDELQQENHSTDESATSIAGILARLGWLVERTGSSGSGMQASASVLERVAPKQEETGRDAHYLDAKVTKDGDLVLEGQDIGPGVEEFWGDSDIEYWVTVDKGFKDTVLLWLVEERFEDDFQFRIWLEEKGIPYSKRAY